MKPYFIAILIFCAEFLQNCLFFLNRLRQLSEPLFNSIKHFDYLALEKCHLNYLNTGKHAQNYDDLFFYFQAFSVFFSRICIKCQSWQIQYEQSQCLPISKHQKYPDLRHDDTDPNQQVPIFLVLVAVFNLVQSDKKRSPLQVRKMPTPSPLKMMKSA